MGDKKEGIDDILWRLGDIRDMLMETGIGGQRLYGCDEWSTPVRNLNAAIAKLKTLKDDNSAAG